MVAQPASCRVFHWTPVLGGCWGGNAAHRRNLGVTLGALMVMNAQPLFTPLTKDELVSLERISVVTTDVLIPVTHMEKLLGAGYVQLSVSGLALTDLGVRRLEQDRVKKEPN
jgi:hypothetical protein